MSQIANRSRLRTVIVAAIAAAALAGSPRLPSPAAATA
jgi:hypothetical protein